MYSEEELEIKCKKAFIDGGKAGYKCATGLDFKTYEDWAEENLKN